MSDVRSADAVASRLAAIARHRGAVQAALDAAAEELQLLVTACLAFEIVAEEIARGDGVQPTEDAARDALIIRGDLDITTVVMALDLMSRAGRDNDERKAASAVRARIGAVSGSDGIYRMRPEEQPDE
jgi:hypothetical protein